MMTSRDKRITDHHWQSNNTNTHQKRLARLAPFIERRQLGQLGAADWHLYALECRIDRDRVEQSIAARIAQPIAKQIEAGHALVRLERRAQRRHTRVGKLAHGEGETAQLRMRGDRTRDRHHAAVAEARMIIQQQPLQRGRAVRRERGGERARAVVVDVASVELDACELGIDLGNPRTVHVSAGEAT